MIGHVPAGRRDGGAALVTALFLMLAVLMIGVAAARTALNAEKSARHERDRHIAFQAAEAALADAERDIEGGADPASARAALFAAGAGFTDGCAGTDAAALGLCRRADPPAPPVWQAVELAAESGVAVPYGQFTGAAMPTGSGVLPARLPRYIVELVPVAGAGTDRFYRITAIGFGTRESTRAVLQSFYRWTDSPAPPSASAPSPVGLPEKRISWREVANWQELHRAAGP
jgi:Tfp pilus assembly protein PilX